MTSNISVGAVLEVALRILSQRVIVLITLSMTFALFCWSMYLGDWLRFAISGAFGLTIFMPVLVSGRPKGDDSDKDSTEA